MIFVEKLFSIQINSVKVLDSLGSPRTQFSNSEIVSLEINCYNETAVDRINFNFYIKDPNGAIIFTHTGNSSIGNVGVAGSSLQNIPISVFYKTAGSYIFTGEVEVSGQKTSLDTIFNIFSPNVSLVYPSNGATDLLQPIVFRWSASGASKYKIYVDDDASFYNTLFVSEIFTTDFEYPQSPSDPLAKLKSDVVYYWKVEGLDPAGNVVATTPFPFSFSLKAEAVTTRDIAIVDVGLNPQSDATSLKLDVHIKNNGNQPQSNIDVSVTIAGVAPVPAQKIDTINQDEIKVVTFDFGAVDKKYIDVSATINIFDDEPKNNTISKTLYLEFVVKQKQGKIIGRVTKADDPSKGIDDAIVVYTGSSNGQVITKSGGQYKIEDLPFGEYSLKASHPDYQTSEEVKVKLESPHKVETNVDFQLKSKPLKVVSISEVWDSLKDMIDKKIVDELKDYTLKSIDVSPPAEEQKLYNEIINKKVKIISAELEK